jgi:hypothetical protein
LAPGSKAAFDYFRRREQLDPSVAALLSRQHA